MEILYIALPCLALNAKVSWVLNSKLVPGIARLVVFGSLFCLMRRRGFDPPLRSIFFR